MTPVSRPAEPRILGPLLRATLPAPIQTFLLRAALEGDAASRNEAFEAWKDRSGGTPQALATGPHAARALAPLLWAAIRDLPEIVPTALGTYLRAAASRAQNRSALYAAILQELLDALGSRHIPFIVLKGAALAWSVYPAPWQRHCHDIDLLVPRTRRAEALDTAESVAFLGRRETAEGAEASHPSGLPLVLHDAPYLASLHNREMEAIWGRAATATVAGRPVRVMAPEDALLHTLLHAACGSRRNGLLWVSDAVFLLRAGSRLNWDAFVERAARTGAAIPVRTMAGYLSSNFSLPVPSQVLEGLTTAETTGLAAEVSVLGVCRTLGWRRSLKLMPSTGARVQLACRLLFPSPRALRAAGEANPGRGTMSAYARRIARPLLGMPPR